MVTVRRALGPRQRQLQRICCGAWGQSQGLDTQEPLTHQRKTPQRGPSDSATQRKTGATGWGRARLELRMGTPASSMTLRAISRAASMNPKMELSNFRVQVGLLYP